MSSSTEEQPRWVRERVFDVPRPYRKAASAWLERGVDVYASTPRPAGAVVFVRDGERGVETLMMHRPGRRSMGMLFFPGGHVEPSDENSLAWSGPSPAQWARTLGSEDIGESRRIVVAAARHAFVETGALLAGPRGDGVAESVEGTDWMRSREQLAVLDVSFADVLAKRSLVFRSRLLRPLGRWITSDFVHQRLDLQFFTGVIPVGQRDSPLTSRRHEDWLGWVDAAALVNDPAATPVPEVVMGRSPDSGEFSLGEVATPGVQAVLESVARSGSAIAFLAARREQRIHVPVLELREGRPVLVLRYCR